MFEPVFNVLQQVLMLKKQFLLEMHQRCTVNPTNWCSPTKKSCLPNANRRVLQIRNGVTGARVFGGAAHFFQVM